MSKGVKIAFVFSILVIATISSISLRLQAKFIYYGDGFYQNIETGIIYRGTERIADK